MAPYYPALAKRNAMSNQDDRITAPWSKGSKALRAAWILVAMLVIAGLAFTVFGVRNDGGPA